MSEHPKTSPAPASSGNVKKHNFSAGPAILPPEVLASCARAVRELDDTGLSLLEISHRSPEFTAIIEEAQALVRELLNVPDDYAVLFLQGGASLQFSMVPCNLLDEDGMAAYLETGNWAQKAIKEARYFGKVEIAGSSANKDFTYLPKDLKIPAEAAYLHITTNNTIYGTQWHEIPDSPAPLVADMSSDIFSRPLDVSHFGLIYAGAQKNLGPAGVTLVIIRKDLAGKVHRDIPTMLDYQTHIKKNSVFNTPPVFSIYGCLQTLKWIKASGGLEAMAAHNRKKATLLYKALDRNSCFKGTVAEADRSQMNVTFLPENSAHTDTFLKLATERGFVGLKGHRSAGGFRASLYNALPMESVEALVNLLKEFEQTHS